MLSSFADATLFGGRTGTPPFRVLALHGWGRTHRDFDQVLAPPGATLDAIALDLPGFGATPPPTRPFSSEDYARAIEPVLREAGAPVVIVGHSHGGRVAVALATMHPDLVQALVLVAAPVLRPAAARRPSFRYRMVRAGHRARLVSEARMEALRQRSGSPDYVAATGVMRDTLVTVVNESFDAELSALTCTVALVWGAADTDVRPEIAERAAAIIGRDHDAAHRPAVSLTILDGVGHLVPTSAPGAVRAAIDQVLA